MFARIKKSGKYQYLQIVENNKVKGKVKQRVIATIGRLDQLRDKGRVETLIRSLSRYSEKAMLVLTGHSDPDAVTIKIGPELIFERLWKQTGIKEALQSLLTGRKFEFDVERAIFLTVLYRLMTSGSDRYCDRWRSDYAITATEHLQLHHLYRAMAFLGEQLADQSGATDFAPRCHKDLIEEDVFKTWRDLFSELELVFFDTTSIYFEGEGGASLGERGFSKDHRPDLKQMVVGVVINDEGRPICCEMWPGNTTDVTTIKSVSERMGQRFNIKRFCIVADRGMISADNLKYLEDNEIPYILGTRMRKDKEVQQQVLTCGGRYREIHPIGSKAKDPSPLKVKEVRHMGRRYIVCLNQRQANKDKLTREAIIAALKEKIPKEPKALVGNKGYRKYVKIEKDSAWIDFDKVKSEERFDGKWVLRTNTDLATDKVALKYKELWQVERVFRDVKSMLETRPIFHQRDDTIRGHVFCSFLALVLRKELERNLEKAGHHLFEWSHIKQDLQAMQETRIEGNGNQLTIRSRTEGVCGKVFQAVGVAIPPTIREI
jgi:hypothetical protein